MDNQTKRIAIGVALGLALFSVGGWLVLQGAGCAGGLFDDISHSMAMSERRKGDAAMLAYLDEIDILDTDVEYRTNRVSEYLDDEVNISVQIANRGSRTVHIQFIYGRLVPTSDTTNVDQVISPEYDENVDMFSLLNPSSGDFGPATQYEFGGASLAPGGTVRVQTGYGPGTSESKPSRFIVKSLILGGF